MILSSYILYILYNLVYPLIFFVPSVVKMLIKDFNVFSDLVGKGTNKSGYFGKFGLHNVDIVLNVCYEKSSGHPPPL